MKMSHLGETFFIVMRCGAGIRIEKRETCYRLYVKHYKGGGFRENTCEAL
jgi:hypothetical protein